MGLMTLPKVFPPRLSFGEYHMATPTLRTATPQQAPSYVFSVLRTATASRTLRLRIEQKPYSRSDCCGVAVHAAPCGGK
jgi:hypothetical protein